jgi:hypothetical protein
MSETNNSSGPLRALARASKKTNSRRTKPKTELVAVAEVLPSDITTSSEAPPLEAEPPHRALARCNARHAKLTEELRDLKARWAADNIRAQQCRQPIPTSQITFIENQRRKLHLELQKTQAEIGRLNKLLREHRALRQGDGAREAERQAPPARGNGSKPTKKCPLKEHREYPPYFLLAARDQLHADLFDQVERAAKKLLTQALTTGVEEP